MPVLKLWFRPCNLFSCKGYGITFSPTSKTPESEHWDRPNPVNTQHPCKYEPYLLYTNDMKNENKKDRFRRLATLRTNTVLKRLKVLGNCSNRSSYEYTEDEINRIFLEIERAV